MKWYAYLILGLFSGLVLGIILAYCIQGQPLFEYLLVWASGGATFGVIVGFLIKGLDMYNAWQSKKELDRKEALTNLKKHTEDLLPELKKIAENPSTSSTQRLFLLAQEHIAHNRLLDDILNGKEGIINTESSYNNSAGKIVAYVKKCLTSSIPEKLGKLEPEHFDLIVEALRSSHENGVSEINLDRTGATEDLSPMVETINSLLGDTKLQEMFDEQKSLGHKLGQLRVSFKREVIKEIDDITYSLNDEAKILLGYCSKCENTKKKWKIA